MAASASRYFLAPDSSPAQHSQSRNAGTHAACLACRRNRWRMHRQCSCFHSCIA
jgi:hypothetical protein